MGSCFAGSAGCGQPGQDAIVVVSGEAVCPPGTFNRGAITPDECLQCWCSGLTDQCTSADMSRSVLPPPSAIFQLFSVNTRTSTVSQYKTRDFSVSRESETSQRLYSSSLSVTEKGVPYFALSPPYIGNNIKSYGGFIRYSLSFSGEGSLIDAPQIILQVISLYFKSNHE